MASSRVAYLSEICTASPKALFSTRLPHQLPQGRSLHQGRPGIRPAARGRLRGPASGTEGRQPGELPRPRQAAHPGRRRSVLEGVPARGVPGTPPRPGPPGDAGRVRADRRPGAAEDGSDYVPSLRRSTYTPRARAGEPGPRHPASPVRFSRAVRFLRQQLDRYPGRATSVGREKSIRGQPRAPSRPGRPSEDAQRGNQMWLLSLGEAEKDPESSVQKIDRKRVGYTVPHPID